MRLAKLERTRGVRAIAVHSSAAQVDTINWGISLYLSGATLISRADIRSHTMCVYDVCSYVEWIGCSNAKEWNVLLHCSHRKSNNALDLKLLSEVARTAGRRDGSLEEIVVELLLPVQFTSSSRNYGINPHISPHVPWDQQIPCMQRLRFNGDKWAWNKPTLKSGVTVATS